jgi:hypothetical protein
MVFDVEGYDDDARGGLHLAYYAVNFQLTRHSEIENRIPNLWK